MNDISLVAADAFNRLSQAQTPNENQLKGLKGSSDQQKIEKSSREFESILLAQWLQTAEKSFATVPGSDDPNSMPGKDQFQGFAMQAVATAMTKGGGIGIADQIASYLTKSSAKPAEAGHEESGKQVAMENKEQPGTKN